MTNTCAAVMMKSSAGTDWGPVQGQAGQETAGWRRGQWYILEKLRTESRVIYGMCV